MQSGSEKASAAAIPKECSQLRALTVTVARGARVATMPDRVRVKGHAHCAGKGCEGRRVNTCAPRRRCGKVSAQEMKGCENEGERSRSPAAVSALRGFASREEYVRVRLDGDTGS